MMTSFGEVPELAPMALQFGAELGSIPWLDDRQQRVGFGGSKDEDLNKSPAFGRVRGWVGLPWGLVGELAWTPPVRIDGAKPEDLFAAAIGGRVLSRDDWTLSLRAHGQTGRVGGDVTCPRRLAGVEDAGVNPFRCLEASDDRIDLRYHAVEATFARGTRTLRGHVTLGLARMEPEVQVDARLRGLRSVPQLFTRGDTAYIALGATRDFGARWQGAAELLWVPLEVRRADESGAGRDASWSLRLTVRYRNVP
jgi:hypothetical protein